MMTDAECVENLSGLSAVKALKPSSRASGREQSALETSTGAESVVHRKGTRIVLYLEPDRFDLQFSTKELTHDVQTPRSLVGGADLSPFFVCSDGPGAISARADVYWSGNEMTCRATSAGAVQLECHEIEAWTWTTHTQWSYLGFICGLARTASASDEVIVNGHFSKRVNGTTTGVMEATDSISTFAVNAGAGGAVAGDAGLACGHEQAQWLQSADAALRCSAVEHPKAGNREEWRVLSAHRWVRQRMSHNRRTPQVTDHGLLSEHQ